MKKLAVIISGAVSLGAYEAGVAYELLEALRLHNTAIDADPQANPNDKIVIDVITGASAGAMTAAILGQKLLFQPERLLAVSNNDLYLPWVQDVDLAGLLQMQADEPPDHSILSSDLIETISKRYMTDPYSTGAAPPESPRHPAADETISLGLALSNLDGIDYGLQILTGGVMPYTRFQDQFLITADSTDSDHNTQDFWEPIRNAAVSSGAFPFAFRVKELLRHPDDYQNPAPLNPLLDDQTFSFVDGGVFQNEPLALAKQLVDEIDEHFNEDRYYLFIAPGMRTSATSNFSGDTDGNLFGTAKALVNAIFNQARYRDLEGAEQINQQIAVFDDQAVALQKLILNGAVTASNISAASGPLVQALYTSKGILDAARLTADKQRLARQFFAENAALMTFDPTGASSNAWLESILLMETVAQLGPKDIMRIYAITDDRDQLAGAGFFAFAGFFDVAYRQHDYDRGRQSVRDFVTWLKTAPPASGGTLGPIRYNIAGLPPIVIDPQFTNLDPKNIAPDKRGQLRDRLMDRIDTLMDEAGVNGFSRWIVNWAFLKSKINEYLGL